MALPTGPAVITDDVDLFHVPPPDFKTAVPHTSFIPGLTAVDGDR
jgi:hypothetical protein